jgi:Asp/Glu/hydantoin racemase
MGFRIALIHATPVSMPPIQQAFDRLWVEAETVNLLDDSLSLDLERVGRLDRAIVQRIGDLADYAVKIGADAILYSCSAFGRAIDTVIERLAVPVLKPNAAMFADAVNAGPHIGMLTTFAPSVASMEKEFRDLTAQQHKEIKLTTVLVEDAMAALSAGDVSGHNRHVAEAARQLSDCDAVMLAQFSTSLALDQVGRVMRCPVLTSPHSAVKKLKVLLEGDG